MSWRFLDLKTVSSIARGSSPCQATWEWRVVFVDPLWPNLHTEGNFPVRFSRRKSIGFSEPYRLTSIFFLLGLLRKYFDIYFWKEWVIPGLVWWAEGRISHTNLKIRVVMSRTTTSKNHAVLHVLFPGQIWDWIRDRGKFWSTSRNDLRHHQNRNFLAGHQVGLSKRTVAVSYSVPVNLRYVP
jgi:hypothetical protein